MLKPTYLTVPNKRWGNVSSTSHSIWSPFGGENVDVSSSLQNTTGTAVSTPSSSFETEQPISSFFFEPGFLLWIIIFFFFFKKWWWSQLPSQKNKKMATLTIQSQVARNLQPSASDRNPKTIYKNLTQPPLHSHRFLLRLQLRPNSQRLPLHHQNPRPNLQTGPNSPNSPPDRKRRKIRNPRVRSRRSD